MNLAGKIRKVRACLEEARSLHPTATPARSMILDALAAMPNTKEVDELDKAIGFLTPIPEHIEEDK